jgi:hypothetical protein
MLKNQIHKIVLAESAKSTIHEPINKKQIISKIHDFLEKNVINDLIENDDIN